MFQINCTQVILTNYLYVQLVDKYNKMPLVQGEMTGGGSLKMIIDGLVCSIAQAISSQPDANELIEAVLREFESDVIYDAWKQYFAVFLFTIYPSLIRAECSG